MNWRGRLLNTVKRKRLLNCLGVLLVPFAALGLASQSATAIPLTFAWNAWQDWPSGTTIELEANGVTADGITATQHTIDVPVQPGEVISARARAIPPTGYQCGDPLGSCESSDWATLAQTLPAVPTNVWGNIETIGGNPMALSIAELTSGSGTSNPGTTASISPTSGRQWLASVAVSVVGGYVTTSSDTVAITGAGLTWTAVGQVKVFGSRRGIYVLKGTGTPSSGALTITFTPGAGATFESFKWGIVEITDTDATPYGTAYTNTSGSGTAASVTVSETPDAGDFVFFVHAQEDNNTDSLNSELDTSLIRVGNTTGARRFGISYDTSPDSTPVPGVTWTGSCAWAAIGFVINAGSSAATVSPNDMLHAQSMDAATLLQAHILSVAELLHSQALDNATITQAFTLTPSDAINTQAIDPTTLLQQSFISPSELLQINSMDATTLLQAHTLAITDLLHYQSIDNATITQASTLTPNDALNAQALDATTLLQQSVISPADLLQGNTLDATTLIQAHTLAIADITHAQTLDNVSLVVAGDISPDEMMTGQAMDAPLLLQAHIISPNDALNAQSIDSPVIVQSNVLIPAGMDHAVILDSPVIVQANVISPSELLTAQAVDNVTLAVFGSLSVADVLTAQAIESPGLTQAHTITPAELTHVNSIDATTLLQGFILIPADLLHGQAMEGALLDVIFGLSPADLLNAQGIESPGLIQAHAIFPADLLQANRFDVAGISSGLLQVPTGRAIVLGASARYVLLTPADRFILLTKST